jgi:putative drug exporter of the RND superfamily
MHVAARIIRHRKWVAAAWLVVVPSMMVAAGRLQNRMVAFARLPGSESAAVEDVLAREFESPYAHSLILVARGLPPFEAPATSHALQRIATSVTSVRGVTAALSPLTSGDVALRGDEPGSAVFLVGIDPRQVRADSLVRTLRRVTAALADTLRSTSPAATLHWTGLSALLQDLRTASATATRQSELRALPVVLVLLLVAFRSVVAAVIPLIFGFLAIAVSLGAALIASVWGTPALLLGNVISILGLALGIDYSLLTVTRFREALAQGFDSTSAAIDAIRNAGHTIVLSGATVALGFAGLLLVPIGEIRSVGLGGLIVALVAVLLATTLLPVLLSWMGRRIDLGKVKRTAATSSTPSTLWYRWARWVTGHAALVLLIAGLPLAMLSVTAFRLSKSAPRDDWLSQTMESARALRDLADLERTTLTDAFPIIVDMSRVTPSSRSEWTALQRLVDTLRRHPRIAGVRAVPTLAATYGVTPARFWELAPESARRHYATVDGRWTRIDIIPTSNSTPGDIADLVEDSRSLDAAAVTGQPISMMIGGVAAFQVDYEDAVSRSTALVVGSVIVSVLLALSIGFRSVLVPVKATVLNLLTVGAGFGSLVLVFQDGWGSSWLGLDQPLSGVFPAVPIMVFCVVFGLSMDYEVFLVGRIAEIRRAFPAMSERDAIIEGVARTGRVITFAAALMIVIFAAFATGDYLPSKLFGFALAVAVFADATLVRLAIGPALLQLAGRWNWWPGDTRKGARDS